MTVLNVIFSICLVLGFGFSMAHANEIEPTHEDKLVDNPSLTLNQVMQATLKRNPQQFKLQALQFNVQAKKDLAQSTFPQSPAVTIYHQNDTIGSGRNERYYQAELEMSVWMPNQKNARAKVAEAITNSFNNSQTSLALSSAGLVRDAVWMIAFNKNELAIQQAKFESATLLQQKVAKSVNAGESAKTDLLLAEQETLAASNAALLAEAEVMHAQFRYKQITGLDALPSNIVETKANPENFENSPIWQEAQSHVLFATESRDLAQIEKKENIQVFINATSAQGGFDYASNQSMGVKVRIPFNNVARTSPIIASTETALGDALSQRDALRMQLEALLHEADHNLEVTSAQLAITKKQAEIAQESLRLSEKAYALGEQDLPSLIRIKNQTFEAQRSYNAMQIQHNWNIAKYNQAVGVLP
jgi:outer membrane protein, heavy metal efflux system